MTVSAATGFWSYVRLDDENSQNHIQALAQQVKSRFQLITGDEIEIFFDRTSIQWGEAWDERIAESIAGTTFFIPIVTPSYLVSDACRAEFLRFWQKVKSGPFRALLMPILYVTTDLPEDSNDEIIQAIRATQYIDWRETQLEDERSSVYKRAIDEIAQRLKSVSDSIAAEPDVPESPQNVEGDSDEPGLFEVVAKAEDAFDDLVVLLERTEENFLATSNGFTEGMETLPQSGKFANRVLHLRNVSHKISTPAKKFAEDATGIKLALTHVRDAMAAAAEFVVDSESETATEEIADALETADQFEAIGNSISENFPDIVEVRSVVRQMTKMSRELREPAKSLEEGMKNLIDATTLFTTIAEEIRRRVQPPSSLSTPE